MPTPLTTRKPVSPPAARRPPLGPVISTDSRAASQGALEKVSCSRCPLPGQVVAADPAGVQRAVASIKSVPQQGQSADVVVVGAGIIGLAAAWRARQRGMAVTVLEREVAGRAASHVAAGMLAPVAEVEFGEDARRGLALGLRSAQMWPEFAAQLEAATGIDVGLTQTGTLLIARDVDQARELQRQ